MTGQFDYGVWLMDIVTVLKEISESLKTITSRLDEHELYVVVQGDPNEKEWLR